MEVVNRVDKANMRHAKTLVAARAVRSLAVAAHADTENLELDVVPVEPVAAQEAAASAPARDVASTTRLTTCLRYLAIGTVRPSHPAPPPLK